MKRIDRLVLREVVGPWAFGIGLFTTLLLAAGPLNRITSFLVGGNDGATVAHLVMLYLPALLVKTFSMSMLLAGLLGFGRLSSDSEIIALKAGGASLPRILRSVVVASVVVAGITYWFNDRVVPGAQREAIELGLKLSGEGKIGGKADGRPFGQHDPKTGKDRLVAMFSARNVDLATRTMQNVAITLYDAQEKPKAVLLAPQVSFNPPDDWRIYGPARIVPLDADINPREVVHLNGGAWPRGVPKPKSSMEDLFSKNDYDSYTVASLRAKIRGLKQAGEMEARDIRDFEYGYYNKFSVALAALVFGPLGAVLGVQNRRSGSASGFALAVGIIFAYIALANFMNVWARGGLLPPWAASFAPLCIGALACGVIIYRRNA